MMRSLVGSEMCIRDRGGVSIDGEKITDVKYVVAKDALAGDGIVLKKGKKKFNKIVAK